MSYEEDILDTLNVFAEKYYKIDHLRNDAGEALIAYLAGDCRHDFLHEGVCELCGDRAVKL